MTETPTGKQRYRSERPILRAERLVLQIEVQYSDMDLIGGWPERVTYNFWRDARTTDLPLNSPPPILQQNGQSN